MQLRRLAALERQRIVDDLAKIEAEIADLEDILAKPERQRAIVRLSRFEFRESLRDLAMLLGDQGFAKLQHGFGRNGRHAGIIRARRPVEITHKLGVGATRPHYGSPS